MANSTPGPSHPTKQQLDELEALMQRMLALPVNQLDDNGSAGLLQFSGPSIVPAVEQPGGAAEEPIFAVSQSQPAQPPAPAGVVEPAAPPPRPLSRLPTRRPARWFLAALLWINRGFDNSVGRLGRPGRWLCTSQGRAILGMLGVLFLLAAAAGLILGTMGWTR